MDFFKSVFSSQPDAPPAADADADADDPEEEAAERDPHGSAAASGSDPGSPGGAEEEEESNGGGGAPWGAFSGLIKTLATRSESVIQTYRRDLEEFGSGLRKETAAIREAIRELPTSLEVGASVAQESLESVGQAIDDLGGSVWRGTADIISQGKDALLAIDSDGSGDPASSPSGASGQSGGGGGGAAGRPYSRFDARVLGIQSDPATFSEEPEDAEEFRAWIAAFQLAEKEVEIESLLAENRALEGNFARLVPQVVDHDTFWSRYFYKVNKLRQAEDVRANLVKRVISREEEEEDLSWEVDDEETPEKDSKEEAKQELEQQVAEEQRAEAESSDASVTKKEELVETKPETVLEEKPDEKSQHENAAEIAPASVSTGENVTSETKQEASGSKSREAAIEMDGKMPPEGKGEHVESCKDSDVSVVSSHPSIPEEDDLGWDEIEDLGDNDEKKAGVSTGSPNKIDLRQRLSAAEDDEDLSWDIEDDDPIKP